MPERQSISVAVLLATHNSGRFIEPQIASLKGNATPFTLHWLDDHSTDQTRERVRTFARRVSLDMEEWHQPNQVGVPGVFFQLLESVEADIYLFCDHDDIWQPGKIDATVAHLAARATTPALCFSEPLLFTGGDPSNLRRYFDVTNLAPVAAQTLSRAFVLNPAVGNTVGFTRPLREIFLSHSEIARTHAIMHDWWLYLVARASGVVQMMQNVPTTLYRQHESNVFGVGLRADKRALRFRWQNEQLHRRKIARQAAGFVLAAATMRPGLPLERLLTEARHAAMCDRRQSPAEIFDSLRRGALPVPLRRTIWFAGVSLLSDASSSESADAEPPAKA